MNLNTGSSPHIRGPYSTARLMWDVVIALIPAMVAGVLVHGVRALAVAMVSVAACVVTEAAIKLSLRQKSAGGDNAAPAGGPLCDGSPVVTGLLLAMTLPVTVSLWIPAVGGVFAIGVVKWLGGGPGRNVFNPALAARAMLLLLWPVQIVCYPDTVTSATPLHDFQIPALPEVSLADLFMGTVGGSMGETSAFAILLGFGWLLLRQVITPRITVSCLGSFAFLALLFAKTGKPLAWMEYQLLSGGLLLAAVFMVTDYSTSPVTPGGKILYGAGCGALTLFFRYYGLFPEGVTYAILCMNSLVWLVERVTQPVVFGHGKGAVNEAW